MSIPEQLLAATKARGWSIRKLHKESGVKCSVTALQRKLRGESTIWDDELQALVDTLQTNVAVVPTIRPTKRKRAA